NNMYPSTFGVAAAPAGGCAGGVAGTGTVNQPQALTEQLTMFSDAAGHTCSIAAPGYTFGPSLRAIPVAPITNSNAVTVVAVAANNPPDLANTVGWRFLNTTGALQINTSRLARDGVTPLSNR